MQSSSCNPVRVHKIFILHAVLRAYYNSEVFCTEHRRLNPAIEGDYHALRCVQKIRRSLGLLNAPKFLLKPTGF